MIPSAREGGQQAVRPRLDPHEQTEPTISTIARTGTKRSRNSCWPCKKRKVKCDEKTPLCGHCARRKESCDYNIRLKWGGRNGEVDARALGAHPAASPPEFEHADPSSASGYASATIESFNQDFGLDSSSPSLQQPTPSSSHDQSDCHEVATKLLVIGPCNESNVGVHSDADLDRLGFRTYGYDYGVRDDDIPHNNDCCIIMPTSSMTSCFQMEPTKSKSNSAFDPGGYYAQPVAIRIPSIFEPLPSELATKPMNLLYFHHFIHRSARVVMPHDCPDNPYRTVFPKMAMQNDDLLHLLLTYSACHRAALLGHKEPTTRIAEWMTDVLSRLRRAVAMPKSHSLEANGADSDCIGPLLTTMLLASVEVVSPNIFGVPISWQSHMDTARQLIKAYGGLDRLVQGNNDTQDKAISICSRWFAYFDIMGALCTVGTRPLLAAYSEDEEGKWLVRRSHQNIFQVDCYLGCSGRCVTLLARVAELVYECDQQRLHVLTREPDQSWAPNERIRQEAEDMIQRFHTSAETYRGCCHTTMHPHSHEDNMLQELYATNRALHWAGRLTLLRRVLNQPSGSTSVQTAVQNIKAVVRRISPNRTANSCLIFPMFTAGCESQIKADREVFIMRLRDMQRFGWQHVARACEIMQNVWDTGRSWESMAQGDFLA